MAPTENKKQTAAVTVNECPFPSRSYHSANMTVTKPTWKAAAEAKRQAVLDLIPEKWRIKEPIPSPLELRDVTAGYIQQFLNARELEITETDAAGIVERTTSGQWTAVEVTEAFCHRAALAHQLVSYKI